MEELEKDFLQYKQALEIKELGFNEPCFGLYYGTSIKEEPEFLLEFRSSQYYVAKGYVDGILAPTYSQAFRWFRERYGVHSSPRKYDETKWWVEWGTWTSSIFETFEEAELSWIKKLIEIVKEK